MAEKKLSGHVVVTVKNIIFHAALLVIIIAPAFCPSAFAAAKRDIPPGLAVTKPTYPVLASLQAQQIGDSSLLIKIRGFDLPLPRVASAPGEARLVLQWDGARFPQTGDKNDWWAGLDWDVIAISGHETNSWWKQYNLPLMNRIIAEPVDADSLKLTFVTMKPVVLEKITGIAGADELSLSLRVLEPEKPTPPPPKPKTHPKGDPMAINAPVTLQLRDAEIKSVFRMLADMQKLNLLLDSSVPDMTVTFSFNAVPYSEAFGYLLRTADLSYSVTKGMLVVGRPESLGRTLGTEVTKAYKLSYAVDENGQVRTDLTGALTGLVPLSAAPTLDARRRELYVTATEEQHAEIKEVLQKLDHPGQQVMLEAQVFEVFDDADQTFESLITAVYNNWIASFSEGAGLNAGYNWSNIPVDWTAPSWKLPLGGSIGGSPVWEQIVMGDTIYGPAKFLSAGLHALETQGKGKTLANPSVITLDGQTATVSLTRNVQYAAGIDANGNPSYSAIEVGPKLNFLPVIGREGMVTIKIEVEAGEIIGSLPTSAGGTVQSSTRKVTTTVRVRDGEPFVVGGLSRDEKHVDKQRIPVLGYIPLLGDMFSYKRSVHNKSEVAIVVIPHILGIPNSDVPTSVLKKTSALP
ncbi:MAG: type II and III secretion system protein [Synergistaceae bacterium]|jgi:type IV pilus assembly protein PilQ|nr:type II and III secretion system protein [Synergistaceae bacterium]